MSNLIVGAVVLAFLGLLVYLGRRLGAAETELGQEKTTSRDLQGVAIEKTEALEKGQMDLERELRTAEHEQETQAYEHENDVTRSRIGFYPKLHPDRNKDNLN